MTLVIFFPIHLPPLRERREDIPLLVEYFVARYASRMKKEIRVVPKAKMEAMCEWEWPGDIRELQNIIERAVILTDGETLYVPLGELSASPIHPGPSRRASSLNLREVERHTILEDLKKTKGRVGGIDGGAAILGMKRTTLQYRMRLLHINRLDSA